MKNHLRLADRQGILTGRHLSEVQVEALFILNFLEDLSTAREQVDRLKYSLIAREDYVPEKLFPEYWPATVVDDEDQVPEGEAVDYDYSNVEWKGPSEADQEELNRMLALLANATGSVTGDGAMNNPTGKMGKWV